MDEKKVFQTTFQTMDDKRSPLSTEDDKISRVVTIEDLTRQFNEILVLIEKRSQIIRRLLGED